MIDITLYPRERGILVGATGTGKSTLATELLARFLAMNPAHKALIIDAKPRYRAEHGVEGLKLRYKNWTKGDFFPGSVGWSDESPALKWVFAQSRVGIFQGMTPKAHFAPNYYQKSLEYALEAFRLSSPRNPILLYVDELYDEMRGSYADSRLLKTIRAGRERHLSVLVGSQRPRSIPLSTLTETTNAYIFRLRSEDDIDHLGRFGPKMPHVPRGHTFFFARDDGTRESSGYAVLARKGAA